MAVALDPRFTFEAFVVGPANRLAVAAARKVAESPGATYNPLFIYSASGLGKTHLLTAIAHEVDRLHGVGAAYQTVHQFMEDMARAVEAGERDALLSLTHGQAIFLLDDVQFLAGRRQLQDELLRAWDELVVRGGQVVLTSDRPPQEIDALDDRLVSRLSGGLIVDMAPPDYETRVAIARRKAEEIGEELGLEVCQVLGRIAFRNVRELQGALNRLVAVQQLEGRPVAPHEVGTLLGAAAAREIDEFGEFLAEVGGTVEATADPAEQTIGDAILTWEGRGYRTRRLDAVLGEQLTVEEAVAVVRRFEEDVARLRAIEDDIRSLDSAAPELGAAPLRDPDRVADARGLLAMVRHRATPPPGPPPGPGLDSLTDDSLTLRAARAVAASPGAAYNPLYVLAPAYAGTRLLAALGNEIARAHDATVAYVEGVTFAAELIEALAAGRVDAWRARYRRADALLLDGLEGLEGTEGAHDQVFQLFEDLHGRKRQLVFAAQSPPQDLPLPDRLRSRLESGLVVEVQALADPDPGGEAATPLRPPAWMLASEKVLWEWPYRQDWIEESLD
jgi:chromosomal replication initiator protein